MTGQGKWYWRVGKILLDIEFITGSGIDDLFDLVHISSVVVHCLPSDLLNRIVFEPTLGGLKGEVACIPNIHVVAGNGDNPDPENKGDSYVEYSPRRDEKRGSNIRYLTP